MDPGRVMALWCWMFCLAERDGGMALLGFGQGRGRRRVTLVTPPASD